MKIPKEKTVRVTAIPVNTKKLIFLKKNSSTAFLHFLQFLFILEKRFL